MLRVVTHEFLTLSEAALLIRISSETLKGWAERGWVPAFRTPTGRWRFQRVEFLAALRPPTHTNQQGAV